MNRRGDLDLDLTSPRSVHIVGVGGAGMSAIATVLARMGHRVSGSDLRESRPLERLGLLDVTTHVGHAAEHLPTVLDAVVISTAIPESNPEVVAARERGIPVLRRADALRAIVATRTTIAVAGSHGKTTTSSMLALILRAAGWHPSFLIGGDLNEVGTNAVFDAGEWLVVEADESDGTFLELAPHDAVVTYVAARPPRPLRRLPGPRRRVRRPSSPGSPASVRCAPTTSSPPPSPPALPAPPSPTGSPPEPTTGWTATRAVAAAAGSRSPAPASRWARSSCRSPAGTTR